MHVKFDWDLRLINWEIYANNSYKVVGNNFGNCDCPFFLYFVNNLNDDLDGMLCVDS